ncbi:hypothetical protein D3C76_956760 [compost metagenome]
MILVIRKLQANDGDQLTIALLIPDLVVLRLGQSRLLILHIPERDGQRFAYSNRPDGNQLFVVPLPDAGVQTLTCLDGCLKPLGALFGLLAQVPPTDICVTHSTVRLEPRLCVCNFQVLADISFIFITCDWTTALSSAPAVSRGIDRKGAEHVQFFVLSLRNFQNGRKQQAICFTKWGAEIGITGQPRKGSAAFALLARAGIPWQKIFTRGGDTQGDATT